jgi:hypothetical protein
MRDLNEWLTESPAAFRHSLILASDSAGFDGDTGRQRPIASIAVAMVLGAIDRLDRICDYFFCLERKANS